MPPKVLSFTLFGYKPDLLNILIIFFSPLFQGVLRMYAPGEGLHERARDLALKIFSTTDTNKDGSLSMQEFVNGAETDKTLMSLIGGQPLL